MLWPATMLGAAAGLALASIPGALLGGLLGQVLDRRLRLHGWDNLRERLGGRAAPSDDELLFLMLGRLAKSEGRVLDGHIQQARQEMVRLDLADAARLRAIAAFNRGKAGKDRLAGHLRRRRPWSSVSLCLHRSLPVARYHGLRIEVFDEIQGFFDFVECRDAFQFRKDHAESVLPQRVGGHQQLRRPGADRHRAAHPVAHRHLTCCCTVHREGA